MACRAFGVADCHSQCAHWLRNDRFFARSAVVGGRRDIWVPPYNRFCRACVSCRECGALSAGGQRRPPLRRTMSFLPPGRCGHRPLRGRCKGCGVKRNPPVTASPCQPPLGKGAMRTGDTDCHDQFANWSRNDRALQEVRCAGRCGHRPLRRGKNGKRRWKE